MAALSQANVALVMGSAFGAEGYVRMSFATNFATLEKGFDALARFLRN
jgi:aspartate aminotransferase